MSNITKYTAPYGKHTIDYIDELPEHATPITTYFNHKLQPIYFWDSELKRVIRKNGQKAYHQYRYMRIDPALFTLDGKTLHVKLSEMISELSAS